MGLSLGPLAVDPPVVLAPMAGVTNSAFRRLCREYGGGLYVSEMVAARALCEDEGKTQRKVSFGPGETVRSVQLYAVDPYWTGEAVRRLVDQGVHHVDLNSGCPSPKVTRKGGGAALALRRKLFHAVVQAAVDAAGGVPVTVKMRMGVDDTTLTYLDAGRAAADAGVAAVALHARTAEQLYSGRARWDAIARLVDALPGLPVLGNGDIWTAADALRMVEQTGCAGVVVGRGCLGRPWLFADLEHAFRTGAAPDRPSPLVGEVARVLRHHADLLVEHHDDEGYGVRDLRKHTGWYLTGYPVGPAARRALSQVSSLAELDDLLGALDPTTPLPPEAEALPRGHLQGPRRVTLPQDWQDHVDDMTVPEGADLFVSGG